MRKTVEGLVLGLAALGLFLAVAQTQGGQRQGSSPVSDAEASRIVGGVIKCDTWGRVDACGGAGKGCQLRVGLKLDQVNPTVRAWRGETCDEIKQLCNYVPCGNAANCQYVWRNHPCDEVNPVCPDPNAQCPLVNPGF
jgi:hypothetical protein